MPGSVFSDGSLPLLLSSVNCSGSEGTLLQCNYSTDVTDCLGSTDAAGVICQGNVSLTCHACCGSTQLACDLGLDHITESMSFYKWLFKSVIVNSVKSSYVMLVHRCTLSYTTDYLTLQYQVHTYTVHADKMRIICLTIHVVICVKLC